MADLIKKNRMLWHISKQFPQLLAQDFFLCYALWEPGCATEGKNSQNCGGPWWLGSPGVFITQACSHWVSSNFSVKGQVSLRWHWLLQRFLLWWGVIFYICLSVSPILRAADCLWCYFSYRSKENCWFFNFSALYLFLEQSGNFQVSYMLDWKLVLFFGIF